MSESLCQLSNQYSPNSVVTGHIGGGLWPDSASLVVLGGAWHEKILFGIFTTQNICKYTQSSKSKKIYTIKSQYNTRNEHNHYELQQILAEHYSAAAI